MSGDFLIMGLFVVVAIGFGVVGIIMPAMRRKQEEKDAK